MPRPQKCRRIASIPGVTFFKPAGVPMRDLEEILVTFEEAEALRLKDLAGMDQEAGAAKMNVSRPTFQRILATARTKVTNALLNGKAIRIGGGNFEMASSRFRCRRGHEWDTSAATTPEETPALCPTCRTPGTRTVWPTGCQTGGKRKGRQNANQATAARIRCNP